MIFTSSTLVQIAVHGHVVSSGGFIRKVYNVFTYHAFQTARYLIPTKAQICTSFSGSIWAGIVNVISQDFIGETFFCWRVNVAGDVFTDSTVAVANGNVAGARLPCNQAAYVGLDSGARGRWYAGTKRMAPIPLSHVTSDEINAGGQAVWNTAILRFARTFNTGAGGTLITWEPVIWTRVLSAAAPPPAGQIVSNIVDAYYLKTLSTWRHRREPTQR